MAIASVLLAGAGVGGVVLWRGLPASRLIAAAKAEDTAKVRQLLAKGTDPNAADREGRTALFAAAGHDHVEIATLLLEKGADAGIVDKSGETPLHLAAMVDGATVAALLIQKGADPNVQDGEGFTPLFLAATIGQPRVAAALLDGGADPNVGAEVAGITITPLDMAMKNGHSQVAELIAARGGRTSR